MQVVQTDARASTGLSADVAAFFASDLPTGDLYRQARIVHRRFIIGGAVTGALLALIICSRIWGLSLWRSPTDYEPDRAACFSCARCFANCPVGRKAAPPATTAALALNPATENLKS
ncbi:MAG: hypothetical protein ABR497_04440 [Kiritimatiellia bacterium]|nr:hypothetical protein [Lentisphaerota bacterium]